jgi:hypothetical protein
VFWGKDFWVVFSSVFVEDLFMVGLGFVLICIFLYVSIQVLKKFPYEKDDSSLPKRIIKNVTITIVFIVLARGDFKIVFLERVML